MKFRQHGRKFSSKPSSHLPPSQRVNRGKTVHPINRAKQRPLRRPCSYVDRPNPPIPQLVYHPAASGGIYFCRCLSSLLTNPRHLGRSGSQSHREPRSGETPVFRLHPLQKILEIRGAFSATAQTGFFHHVHHTFHHNFTTKTPSRSSTFPKTPLKTAHKTTKIAESRPVFFPSEKSKISQGSREPPRRPPPR
jgi:hypothetical protein